MFLNKRKWVLKDKYCEILPKSKVCTLVGRTKNVSARLKKIHSVIGQIITVLLTQRKKNTKTRFISIFVKNKKQEDWSD